MLTLDTKVGGLIDGSVVAKVAETVLGTALSPFSIVGEALVGTIDGVNLVFTIAHQPDPTKIAIFRNGIRQKKTAEYTVSGATNQTITFVTAPLTNDDLVADYWRL